MHMVIYRSSDGKPSYQEIEQLEEAVRFVERLRNEQGVTDAKLFDLVEVPISFKTYYQVEVGGRSTSDAPAPQPAPEAPAAAASPAPTPAPAVPAASEAPAPPADAKPTAPSSTPTAPAKPASPAPASASAAPKPGEKVDAAAANGGGRFGLFGKS